jgi:WD40 repeat protein
MRGHCDQMMDQSLKAGAALLVLILLAGTSVSAAEPTKSGRKRGLVHALAFSPDGSLLAVGGESIRVYEVNSGRLVTRWTPPPMSRTIGFLPPGNDVVFEAGDGKTIRFHKLPEERPFRELSLHTGLMQHVVLSPDGKLAASTAAILINYHPSRAELRIWNSDTGKVVGSVDVEIGTIGRPVFAADGKTLLVPMTRRLPSEIGDYGESTVELYEVETWKPKQSIFIPGQALSGAFHPNDRELLVAGVGSTVSGNRGPGKIWRADLRTGRTERLELNDSGIFNHVLYVGPEERFIFGTTTEVEFGPDGRTMLPQQARVLLRSDRTGREIWESTSGDDRTQVQAIAVSPNGEIVAWCTYGTIFVLEVREGKLIHGIGISD